MKQAEIIKSIGFPQDLHKIIELDAQNETRSFPQQVRHILAQHYKEVAKDVQVQESKAI